MRIVLTGSSGFLGSGLRKQLIKAGHQVCLLVRNQYTSFTDTDIKCLYYNGVFSKSLIDYLSLWKPDIFYHLAWEGVGSSSRNNPEVAFRNIELTYASVELAKLIGCSKWIGIGSQAEYGVLNRVIAETDICRPKTYYGKAKLIAGQESLSKCYKYNIQGVWARVFSVYGPQDHFNTLLSYVIQCFINKTKPKLSSGFQKWDYLFISDACDALVSLADDNVRGVFNVASGRTVELRKLVDLIKVKMNYKGEIGWGVRENDELIFLCGSIKKIQSYTSWKGPLISLNDGIDILINYKFNSSDESI
jgi:UDP-glucose 4-epimerase